MGQVINCTNLEYAQFQTMLGKEGRFKQYTNIDSVKYRAIRLQLGVVNFTPNMSILGNMGWTDSSVRCKFSITRYWKRLVNLDNDRLTKKVFILDTSQASDTKKVF